MKLQYGISLVLTAASLWVTGCMSPAEPEGVKTKGIVTLDTGGYCKDLAVNDSLIIAAADENGYQVYRYQFSGSQFSADLVSGENDINQDGYLDKLRDVILTEKINLKGHPLFFLMDYGDIIYYRNVFSQSIFNYQVPEDGSINRERVRSITVDDTGDDYVIMYVLKESEDGNSNYISIRPLDIQYDLVDSAIVFWGVDAQEYAGLNIYSRDIYFADSLLAVANSQLGMIVLKQDSAGNLSFLNSFDGIPGEVVEVYIENGILYGGLSDDKGCYIVLLDSNGNPQSTLRIADGYSVQGINASNGMLALACGSDGVLLYSVATLNGEVYADEIGRLDTEYAYQVKIVDQWKIMAATRAGIQVLSIEY